MKSISVDSLRLGVCYYPEHWPEELWADDFQRMREMNISIIRVAEFAWSLFESEEGIYDFGFFRRVLDLAHDFGLKVILGTPTATPPAWLTHRYPEVLNANMEGVLYRHGARRHYNYSSPKYKGFCAKIVREMAEAYKDHPAVIGWQIDNELNCEVNTFYSEADHTAFREWVKNRYGTLEQVNKAWGTIFWSQTYTDWEQVRLTQPTVSGQPNPHLALDEKRFISDNTIFFAKLQADIIRELAPHHWITTNGTFGHLDNHELTENVLDFFSHDSYPQFSTISPNPDPNPLMDRGFGMGLSNVRSISPNFCIMEQQAGPGGSNRFGMGTPRPGQIRLWSYQSILHGADLLVYFRWRTATFGTEIYWHGINDYHNEPNRRIQEVAQVGEELQRIGALVAGTTYRAEVAIMQDYDNAWDGEFDEWHGPLHGQSLRSWYKQLQYRHIPADILTMSKETVVEDLLKYKVIVYPHPAIMSDHTAALLAAYAEQGGRLLFGARTGYKNTDGHCYMRPFPGVVAKLCGITIEDYTIIKGTIPPAEIHWNGDITLPEGTKAVGFNEIILPADPKVKIVAEYASEYYAGKPAMTKRPYGHGEVWYYGAAFHEPVVDALIDELGLASPSAGWWDAPPEVEFGIRASNGKRYAFLLNYSDRTVNVRFKKAFKELLSGTTVDNEARLEPYGVFILEQK
ncbi:beta-galactosidase [Paenibacillus phytohabitans]|uniref:beta-galactosidase n=1 Tax=Paenibacillus phytohabitans TaxID=2654978 RepID=UPI0030098333